MYHVTGTGLTTILLYLISYFFCKLGFFPINLHRKIWNSVLAISFLITAIAGVFIALQITYKWDLQFIKTVLKWHVEFGVGMACSGIFHLIWHLSYYKHLFGIQEQQKEAPSSVTCSPEKISLNLFIVGLVSSSVQLLLLREMMNIAGGYELITGIFLGSWLTGSAAGSLLAGRSRLSDLKTINIVFAGSPLFSVILMFLLTSLFLSPGESPSFLVSIIFTLLVLLPFCLVSGFTFVRLTNLARTDMEIAAGRSFSAETLGGVVAGIAISILTSGLLNTYQILLLIIILALSYAVLSYSGMTASRKMILKLAALVSASAVILTSPDKPLRELLLHGIKVIRTEDTPYGNITLGEYKGEKSVYYDQRLLSYNNDVTEREENIHYAMLQSDSPQKVILISGSLQSQLPEILKYHVKEVTFIERDPALTDEWPVNDDSLNIKLSMIWDDAFRFIRNTNEKADVIILSVPPPSTLQLNRYYSTEFFKEVRKKLKEGGVFVCSPCPANDYFNKESVQLFSSVHNSLAAIFSHVEPVVGNKLYFIASDKELFLNFCELTERKNISNTYVCRDYLSDDLILKKSSGVKAIIDPGAQQNRLGYPVASYRYLIFSLTKTTREKIPSLLFLFMVFALPVLLVKKSNLSMYFSASALAGFEIVLLISLQMIIGNMYQLSGLVIAALMAGLAVGSGTWIRWMDRIALRLKVVVLFAFYAVSGLFYNLFTMHSNIAAAMLIILTGAFIPAAITGSVFSDLTKERKDDFGTASVYSSDLAGSAFGFLIISGILIPLAGIRNSLFLIALFALAGFLTIKSRK
jgi:spermidine synthase